MQHVTIVTFYT